MLNVSLPVETKDLPWWMRLVLLVLALLLFSSRSPGPPTASSDPVAAAPACGSPAPATVAPATGLVPRANPPAESSIVRRRRLSITLEEEQSP